MKPQRKIINMDYRKESAATKGMFAEPHWPRDDETIESNYHRLEGRAQYKRTQSEEDRGIGTVDVNDKNEKILSEGRRQW